MSEQNELPQQAPPTRCKINHNQMVWATITLLISLVVGGAVWGVYHMSARDAARVATADAVQAEVSILNRRMDKIEKNLTLLTQQIHQLAQVPAPAADALAHVLKTIQKVPELQLQLADLDEAIRMGRPFIDLYRPLAPFLDISPQDALNMARFRALAQHGVPSYEQLRGRFRGVGDALLRSSAGTGTWYEKLWAGFKGALALRPLPAIIEHPRTAADYVRTFEAFLDLHDTDNILQLLDHAPSCPRLAQWAQDFRDYCFVQQMQRHITRLIMRNALKGEQ